MRYLAIDLGDKRTGLAVADEATRIPTPLTVIEASDEGERLRRIGTAIEAHGAEALVLGFPLNMDGTEGPAAKRARDFAGALRATFDLPVHLVDERLSSEAAESMANAAFLKGRKRRARLDALAAVTILSDFLARS